MGSVHTRLLHFDDHKRPETESGKQLCKSLLRSAIIPAASLVRIYMLSNCYHERWLPYLRSSTCQWDNEESLDRMQFVWNIMRARGDAGHTSPDLSTMTLLYQIADQIHEVTERDRCTINSLNET